MIQALAGNGRRASAAVRFRSGRELVERLTSPRPLLAVELRPPRRDRGVERGVDRWIDMYHAIQALARHDTLVFTTDNAVGAPEEESLRHLTTNLGTDADLSTVLPFLTTKHDLEYCLRFPDRAFAAGHRAVVVLGGDRHQGPARCVAHAAELRAELRERYPGIALGACANPYRDPAWQIDLLLREEGVADFFLTQVVSHHDLAPVERFLAEAEEQKLALPALFGVFYYRSARPTTLRTLSSLMPVPVEGLTREFGAGAEPGAVCARTLAALRSLGQSRAYVCNLQPRIAARTRAILASAFA